MSKQGKRKETKHRTHWSCVSHLTRSRDLAGQTGENFEKLAVSKFLTKFPFTNVG